MPLLALVLLAVGVACGDEEAGRHRLVIQVSGADTDTHGGALRNAINLQNALGIDGVRIEIVAWGAGLDVMTAGGVHEARVRELLGRGVVFSACGNTLRDVREAGGEPVKLVEGVRVVPAGVLRILELQEQGYTYLRP